VINGRKWWITGAMNPNAKIFIVMGETDPWRRPEIPNVIAGQILG
jgi:alkylation response protein AidB-like acyl-CoA dehydrogenase